MRLQAEDRSVIEATFEVFESACQVSWLPESDELTGARVLLRHGRRSLWRDLEGHLREHLGLEVEPFEVGVRTGHGIRDVLAQRHRGSTFAIVAMTGEDEMVDNGPHSTLNGGHELDCSRDA